MDKKKLEVVYVPLSSLNASEYNPRKWDDDAKKHLKESIIKFGVVDPLIVNSAESRKNTVIGGHFRLSVLKELGHAEAPVVFVNIPDVAKEKELNLRLNKNTGEFDFELLADFDESFLSDVGFTTEELDDIFPAGENPEVFDAKKELEKIGIDGITVQQGDIYELDGSRVMCGDSMNTEDVLKLMGGALADLCFTDPPYLLDYLKGKKKSNATEGFGYKRDRHYDGTDELPDDFTEKWMANIAQIANPGFSIIVFENWKNIRTLWGEMEKYWKLRNMIVWHLPNRTQGFAAKHKFFSKHDIAMVGTSGDTALNTDEEDELLQNEYETALYASSKSGHWEAYEKGKRICPTDFVEFKAADEKSSGQGLVFGTKPIEILIPYIKVLTKRGDLIVDPFGGSGSTLVAALKMNRRCYVMEKSPMYTEVILKRWEIETGRRAVKKIHDSR